MYLINPICSGNFSYTEASGCHCGCSTGGMDTYAEDRDGGNPGNCKCQCDCINGTQDNWSTNGFYGLANLF
jgi:hypothetical protein